MPLQEKQGFPAKPLHRRQRSKKRYGEDENGARRRVS
jgi:hypothetical protein